MPAWTPQELEALVEDYLSMLQHELNGQQYNKSVHRRRLAERLRRRTEGSIERKHQNVSAVLAALGCPWIPGYKPLPHYQRALMKALSARLARSREFDEAALAAVERPAAAIAFDPAAFDALKQDAPRPIRVEDASLQQRSDAATASTRDYFAREAANRSLGAAGEEFVLAYERHRLVREGKPRLSDRVDHVAKTKGDGLGYDILSFETSGKERFIEVKTTAFAKETPFYLSRNELRFSKRKAEQFHLYRVFEFRRAPRFFSLTGDVEQHCLLDPVTYLGRFS